MSKIWVMLALLLVAGCGGSTPTSPKTDWLDLNGITPPGGTTLAAGERLTITASLTATVARADGGRISMRIVDQGGRRLDTGQSSELPAGTTTVTLTDAITVPASGGRVEVQMPLWINSSNVTAMAKVVSYSVK